jgi:hypothetical protein
MGRKLSKTNAAIVNATTSAIDNKEQERCRRIILPRK